GADVMEVQLEFLALGHHWILTRTASRAGHPRPRVELRCDALGVTLDRATEVRAKVAELVGLTYDQFLRTVILPQGRFQQLLYAAEHERAGILKGILGMDVLERVRAWAEDFLSKRRPRLERLRGERYALMRAPDEEAEQARAAIAALEPLVASLERALDQCQDATATAAAAARRAESLERARRVVAEDSIDALCEELDGLARVEAGIDDDRRALSGRIAALTRDRDAVLAGRDGIGLED